MLVADRQTANGDAFVYAQDEPVRRLTPSRRTLTT